jgi:Flp pilus assembly protein TadG
VTDEGSAVVENVMVTALLLAMVLGVVQVGVALHIRNTLAAAAHEGARFGANADQSGSGAVERTESVIDEALPSGAVDPLVSASTVRRGGVEIVVVEVTARLPVIGPWGPSGALRVRGQALMESS